MNTKRHIVLCALAMPLAIMSVAGCNRENRPSSDVSDLNGTWRMHLLGGKERDVELVRIDDNHYRFLFPGGVFAGVYQLRGKQLVMEKPDDSFQNKFDDKYQWQFQTDKELVLIAQPPAEKYGNNYIGTKLQRE